MEQRIEQLFFECRVTIAKTAGWAREFSWLLKSDWIQKKHMTFQFESIGKISSRSLYILVHDVILLLKQAEELGLYQGGGDPQRTRITS